MGTPPWNDSTRELIAFTNSVPVSVEDLTSLVDEIEMSQPEMRDWQSSAIVAVRLFNGDPDKVEAVMFRLEALMRLLIADKSQTPWTISLPDGVILTSEPVFAAAACEPIVENAGEVAFDREKFLSKVLELAEVDEIA